MRMAAHTCSSSGRSSGADECSSFATYWKMPTLSACCTAQPPSRRKPASSCSARTRCDWESSACRSTGRYCSGIDMLPLLLPPPTPPTPPPTPPKPPANPMPPPPLPVGAVSGARTAWPMAISSAVSWSAKNVVGAKWSVGAGASGGSCARQRSTAWSHTCQSGCACIGGSCGSETTVACRCHISRSASTKLRSSAASSTSCRKRRRKSACGSSCHAIESATAVSTQLSSPSGERRSPSEPGMAAIRSAAAPRRSTGWHESLSAVSSGCVRHAVKTSAGKVAELGSRSSASVAPSAISGHEPATPYWPCGDDWTCSASARTTRPAHGQSSTKSAGAPSQSATSTARTGTYSVNESENIQNSPSCDGAGTPCPLKWKSSASSLASRRSLRQLRCTSSTVGSRHCLKTAERELCSPLYCASSCFPIRATTLRGSTCWLDS